MRFKIFWFVSIIIFTTYSVVECLQGKNPSWYMYFALLLVALSEAIDDIWG
jgi:hypothetical protein